MKYIDKIWDAMNRCDVDLETQNALIEIIDGYVTNREVIYE